VLLRRNGNPACLVRSRGFVHAERQSRALYVRAGYSSVARPNITPNHATSETRARKPLTTIRIAGWLRRASGPAVGGIRQGIGAALKSIGLGIESRVGHDVRWSGKENGAGSR
jgi:hypothetical protein